MAERSLQFRPQTAVVLVVAILFIALGVVYLTTAAGKLPSVLPGHEAHATRHHVKHGIAMFSLAALAVHHGTHAAVPLAPAFQ